MPMALITAMAMLMGMVVGVTVFMAMRVAVITLAAIRQMHIKLHPINRALLPAVGTQCISLQLELL